MPKRKIKSTTVRKPRNKPAAKPAASTPAPVAATPAATPDTDATRHLRGLHRDINGIAALRTHFGSESGRDAAYLAMLGENIDAPDGTVTLGTIRARYYDPASDKSFNPFYAGSGKATDVGAFNRLRLAGAITVTGDTVAFVPNDTATDADGQPVPDTDNRAFRTARALAKQLPRVRNLGTV